MRQVVLDTETTGLEVREGHRIIEIGCVELEGRRLTGNKLHMYLQPDREIDAGAIEVHKITNEFLADKPRFADVAEQFVEFIRGSELVIHNAPFDVGFIDSELRLLGESWGKTEDYCQVLDTLVMARKMHPGKKNTLDALCTRYDVDNSRRTYHGALLDAEILADVYLMMTGGQTSLGLNDEVAGQRDSDSTLHRISRDRPPLPVITATADELSLHREQMEALRKESGGACLWDQLDE
ncbi:MAG: DNA polymerase III subunit epsilon [Pseudomonadota bacterium]